MDARQWRYPALAAERTEVTQRSINFVNVQNNTFIHKERTLKFHEPLFIRVPEGIVSDKAEIRKFVRKLLVTNGDTAPLTDQDSLLLSGRLQSIDVVEIVMFLDQNYGIDITQADFEREQIDSVDAIHLLTGSPHAQLQRD